MEKIFVTKLEWRTSSNGSNYARINNGDYRLWARQDDIETLNVLVDGAAIEVDVYQKDKYKNIVAIKGIDGEIYRWDRNGNVCGPQGYLRQPPEGVVPPLPFKPKIETPPQLEKELQQGGQIIDRISLIVKEIKDNFDTLTEDRLTKLELQLSALNVDIAKLFSANNAKANQLDLEFRDKVTKKAKELQSIDPELSDTKAKTLAENGLWQDKVALTIQQDKANSNEVIINGINNLLFAIKDRLKYFRK